METGITVAGRVVVTDPPTLNVKALLVHLTFKLSATPALGTGGLAGKIGADRIGDITVDAEAGFGMVNVV